MTRSLRLLDVLIAAGVALLLLQGISISLPKRILGELQIFSAGDTLKALPVKSVEGRKSIVRFSGLAGCQAMIFYRSSCPACSGVADEYSGRDRLTISELDLPLTWVADDSDLSASDFARGRLPRRI